MKGLELGERTAAAVEALWRLHGFRFRFRPYPRRTKRCAAAVLSRNGLVVCRAVFAEEDAESEVGRMVESVARDVGETAASLRMKLELRGDVP